MNDKPSISTEEIERKLSDGMPQADPAFEASLEDQVMMRLHEKYPRSMRGTQMEKIKRKNTSARSRTWLSLPAAMIAIMLAGGIYLFFSGSQLPAASMLPGNCPQAQRNSAMVTVRAGETLQSIANSYRLPIEALIEINCLNPSIVIHAGDGLYVPNKAQVPIMLAAENIAPGTKITQDLLFMIYAPQDVVDNMLADIEGNLYLNSNAVIGQTAQYPIARWQPLTEDLFTENSPLSERIPADRVAIIVNRDMLASVPDDLHVYDRVEISTTLRMTEEMQGSYPELLSEYVDSDLDAVQVVISENALVLQITSDSLITVALLPKEAVALTWIFDNEMSVSIAPISPEDNVDNLIVYSLPQERFIGDYGKLENLQPVDVLVILDNGQPYFPFPRQGGITSSGTQVVTFSAKVEIGTNSYTDEAGIQRLGTSLRLVLWQEYADILDYLTLNEIEYTYTLVPIADRKTGTEE